MQFGTHWFNQVLPLAASYHEEMLERDRARPPIHVAATTCKCRGSHLSTILVGFGDPGTAERIVRPAAARCDEQNFPPGYVLHGMNEATVALPGTTSILARFRDLGAELAAMQPMVGDALIDFLFPDEEGFQAIRKARVLVGRLLSPRTLLDFLRTAAARPEMPTEGDFVAL